MEPNVPSDISTRAEQCLRLFERWKRSDDSRPPKAENPAALFRLWATNNFVFTQDYMCLDWRLRNAGVIATVIQDLLDSLKTSLSKIIETTLAADSFAEELDEVEDIQSQLFDICRAVQRSGILSRLSKLHSYTETLEFDGQVINLSERFRDSVLTVIEKRHPQASKLTKERIADTISIRQRNLSYLRDREQRASTARQTQQATSEKEPAAHSRPHRPLTTTGLAHQRVGQPKLKKAITHVRATSNIFAASTANVDKALKAPSVRSSSTFMQASHATDSMIPRPPKGTTGTSHVKCPYCFLVCPVQELRGGQWKKHFIRDIMPYVCLLDGCPTPDVLFGSFREWTAHMTNQHPYRTWACSNRSHEEPYRSNEIGDFEEHMRKFHGGTFRDSDLEELVEASLVSNPRQEPLTECPLCVDCFDTHSTPVNDVLNHVADHLISLAMLSLPDNDGCDPDESDKFVSRSGSTSSSQARTSSTIAKWLQVMDLDDDEQALPLSPDIKNIPDLEPAEVIDWRQMWSKWKGKPLPTYERPDELKLKSLEYREDSLSDTSEQPEDDISTVHTKHYLPLSRNRKFVGREDVVDNLQQLLFANPDHQRVALVGLGGMGKTQIALQIAHLAKNNALKQKNYSVLWIPALSMASFEQACTAIIKDFLIECAADKDPKQAVRDFLSSDRAGKWLLIIDNTDDISILYGPEQQPGGIADFLPDSDNGRILFTTRSQKVAANIAYNVVELHEMSVTEAKGFLEKSLIKKDQIRDGRLVDELLYKLTRLPLAIVQASAYMNTNMVSIKEYLRLFRNTNQDMVELLSRGFRNGSHYQRAQGAVAITWIVSFNQIHNTDKDASRLLSFAACIEPKAIPRTLLPSLGSEQRMTSAIGTLCGYSFLSQREDSEIYDMHSLVHLATQLWTESHNLERQQRQAAMTRLAEVFPTDAWEYRELWRQYFPHALQVLHTAASDENGEICQLGYWVGRCLLIDGRIQEAVKLLQHVVAIEGKTLAEDHPDRLASQHELARAYRANGQVKEAVELLQHVVAIREKTLAEDHPSRLASQHELARAYQANGQVQEAVQLLQHVVAINEKTLAEDNPDRLASQHTLAEAYYANGKTEEAIKLLEYVVTMEKTFAENHPSRVVSRELLMYFNNNVFE